MTIPADPVSRLHAIADAQPFTTTWCLRDMRSGAEADRDGDRPLPSAGTVSLDEPCTVTEELKHEVASGNLRYMTSSLTIPLRDAMVQMILLSDDMCTKMVLERLTLLELNDFCAATGMTGTTYRWSSRPWGSPMITRPTPSPRQRRRTRSASRACWDGLDPASR